MRKIKGQPGFIRDDTSGAIINNDNEAYKLYKNRRKVLKQKDEKINNLQSKVEDLEKLVNELIKQNKN